MSLISSVTTIFKDGEEIVEAALTAHGGVSIPGAPPSTAVITTIKGLNITFAQLVTAAKFLEGASLGTKLGMLIKDLGDVENDLDVTIAVATVLNDLGVPYANDAILALNLVKVGYAFLHVYGPDLSKIQPITPPRSPLPTTAADWSHLFK